MKGVTTHPPRHSRACFRERGGGTIRWLPVFQEALKPKVIWSILRKATVYKMRSTTLVR